MKFSTNEKVILKTFLGEVVSPRSVRPADNYWILIGKSGIIAPEGTGKEAEIQMKLGRALVIFDEDINATGLNCHNEIPNSLWILMSDLVFADSNTKN